MLDPVITTGFRAAQFQPVQRALACQRRAPGTARVQLASQYRQDRIVSEAVVIDQILIPQGNPRHALEHQGANIILFEIAIRLSNADSERIKNIIYATRKLNENFNKQQ